MPSDTNNDFFDEKKPWSRRKDRILTYYLDGYLKIVPNIPPRLPILIVDAFAGRGRFRKDNEPGSPVLICEKVVEARQRAADVDVRCIEFKKKTFDELVQFIEPYSFASARHGRFLDFAAKIAQAAETRHLFLYLDPFAVEGLEWEALELISSNIRKKGTSIEVLLNFNSIAFVRRARAALGKPDLKFTLAPDEDLVDEFSTEIPLPIERLDKIVGGSWWQDIIHRGENSIVECQAIVVEIMTRISDLFGEACAVGIKAKQSHSVTKYHLIFASRAPLALKIMNDGMVKAKREEIVAFDLFEQVDLRELVLRHSPDVTKKIARDDIAYNVVRDSDGMARFEWKEIEHEIARLVEEGILNFESSTGKINRRAHYCPKQFLEN